MAFRKFVSKALFPKNDGRRAHAQEKSQAQKAQQEIKILHGSSQVRHSWFRLLVLMFCFV
jgi:hypothetical protein